MIRVFLFSLYCSFILNPVFAQKNKSKGKDNQVLFTAGNSTVKAGEFIHIYRKNHINPTKDYHAEAIENYLDLFIKFKLKVNEAKSLGMDTVSEFKTEFASYKEELKRPYMADADLLDELVLEAYERYKTEINASHILVGLSQDASPADTLQAYNKITNIRNRAISGEDFSVLASTLSEDPSAKYNFGNLGWFTSMQMVYPVESAAYNTLPGQISDIVKTRFGYHILLVHERRPSVGEIEIAHIMLRTGPDKDSTRVAELAHEVFNKLNEGSSWDEMCMKYSDDANTKSNGGKFRPFRTGAFASVPEFEQMAFSLDEPGSYSKPFTTAFGWHIVKLVNKIPLPEFEQMASSLKSRVSRDERLAVSRKKLIAKLKNDYQYKEMENVKHKTFSAADSSLNNATWRNETNSQEIIAKLKNENILLSDFYKYVEAKQQVNNLNPSQYMAQLYDAFIEEIIMDMEEGRLIRENEDLAMLLQEYEEGLLLFEIMEQKVWNMAVTDTIGLKAFYEAHTHDYTWPQRIKADVYSHSSSMLLQELEQLLDNEIAIGNFCEKHKIKPNQGIYANGDSEIIDSIDWEEGVTYHKSGNLNYLVVVEELLPVAPKAFNEAKGELIADYQEYLEQQWIGQLNTKYPVQINQKAKKYVLSVLQQ